MKSIPKSWDEKRDGWLKSWREKDLPTRIWQVVDGIGWIAFILFLAFLPVTSFPYFPPAIGGGALVRPLSVYPLFVIIILVILPGFFRQRQLHSTLALGFFFVVVSLSGLMSLLRDVNPAFDVSSQERVLRVLVTLAMGCAMYLAVVITPRNTRQLDASLKALYAGFSIALAWGSLQVIYVLHFVKPYYRFLNEMQSLVSSRRLIANRVSGMTYEPNWFAVQISMLLLPWLIASVLTGRSVFSWRWRFFTLELFLLVWSTGILLFTYSRAGLLNLVILALASGIMIVITNRALLLPGSTNSLKTAKKGNSIRQVILVVLVLVGLLSVFFFIGSQNDFFTRIWRYWQKPNASLEGYFEYLGFGARQIYGDTALNTFYSYPWMGVGPGNYALYFAEMLPYQPIAKTPEVLRVITPEAGRDRLITAKNFFLRLLAETGIIGTAAFIGFLITIISSMIFLLPSHDPAQKTWGIGSLLALLAFTFSTLSFDSFALPNMWVAFGFISAAFKIYVAEPNQ
jgi:uncharacterized membrane protein